MRNYFIISTLIISLSIHAQIQLKGNAKDSNNLAIPYCSIGMKNSEIGAITDENGNFSIEIPENNTQNEIVFEAAGYDEKIVSVKDLQQNSTIILHEKSINLNEVLVKTEQMNESADSTSPRW